MEDDDDGFGDLYTDALPPFDKQLQPQNQVTGSPAPDVTAASSQGRLMDLNVIGGNEANFGGALHLRTPDSSCSSALASNLNVLVQGKNLPESRGSDLNFVSNSKVGRMGDLVGNGKKGSGSGSRVLERGKGGELRRNAPNEGDLQMVLNDNSHAPMVMKRMQGAVDDGEPVVIEADYDDVGNHHHQAQRQIDDQKWGGEEGVPRADGIHREKDLGGTAPAPVHPFSSHFKYSAVPFPGEAPGEIPGQVQKGFHHGYESGMYFTGLPHKTIFEVRIDCFEEKPWKLPGVDISDFFNYGFNEDDWKDYCKVLEQLQLELTMQKKICVYDIGRVEQHIGRPIPVEIGSGDRKPSVESRHPRWHDMDTIIEIPCHTFEDGNKMVSLSPAYNGQKENSELRIAKSKIATVCNDAIVAGDVLQFPPEVDVHSSPDREVGVPYDKRIDPTMDDRSSDLKREELAVDAPNKATCEDEKLMYSKIRELSSLVEQLCQEYDNVEDSKAERRVETSRPFSGIGDQCRSPYEVGGKLREREKREKTEHHLSRNQLDNVSWRGANHDHDIIGSTQRDRDDSHKCQNGRVDDFHCTRRKGKTHLREGERSRLRKRERGNSSDKLKRENQARLKDNEVHYPRQREERSLQMERSERQREHDQRYMIKHDRILSRRENEEEKTWNYKVSSREYPIKDIGRHSYQLKQRDEDYCAHGDQLSYNEKSARYKIHPRIKFSSKSRELESGDHSSFISSKRNQDEDGDQISEIPCHTSKAGYNMDGSSPAYNSQKEKFELIIAKSKDATVCNDGIIGGDILKFSPEVDVYSNSDREVGVSYDESRSTKERKNVPACSSIISTSANKRGKYTADDLKEELSLSDDGKQIPALSSFLYVQSDMEQAVVVGHETTDVSTIDGRSFDLEREEIAAGAPNGVTFEDEKLLDLKKLKLSSQAEQLCQQYDNVEVSMAATSLGNSKWSGSSDQCTSPDDVLQGRTHKRPPQAGNIKRKRGDADNPHSKDHCDKDEDGRQNMGMKGREDFLSSGDISKEIWHRIAVDDHWRRTRYRCKLRESKTRESQLDNDSWRGANHDRDIIGSTERDGGDNHKCQNERVDDFHSTRRKREAHMRSVHAKKEDAYHTHRESSSQRKRERSDSSDQLRRDNQARLKNNEVHYARQEEEGSLQMERSKMQRESDNWYKIKHDEVLSREREETQPVVRSGQAAKEKTVNLGGRNEQQSGQEERYSGINLMPSSSLKIKSRWLLDFQENRPK